jgi:transcriptional regulator with XRE-family HTH domain
LREFRGKTTLEDLSGRTGLAISAISKLEHGGSDPQLGSLLRLQWAFGLDSIEELLGPLPKPGPMPSAVMARQLIPDEPAAEAS